MRDLSESLSSDVASRMAEEVQSTQGDPLPGDLNDRHADLAARALANVLLLAAKGPVSPSTTMKVCAMKPCAPTLVLWFPRGGLCVG